MKSAIEILELNKNVALKIPGVHVQAAPAHTAAEVLRDHLAVHRDQQDHLGMLWNQCKNDIKGLFHQLPVKLFDGWRSPTDKVSQL